jgi:hypothetical protein
MRVQHSFHLFGQEKGPKTSGPFSHFVERSTLLAAAGPWGERPSQGTAGETRAPAEPSSQQGPALNGV